MKALLFDLDGTLLNTITDLTNATNHTLARYGYPTHTEEAVLAMVGRGIRNLVISATPGGEDNPNFEAILADYLAYYEVHKLDATAPYAGISEMLAALKEAGYLMAIVSNKLDGAVRELHKMFFSSTVSIAIGERAGMARKPAPDLVHLAMDMLGVSAEDCMYVGDSEVDIATAKNSGLPCLSVTWGFRTEAALREAGGERFFATPKALAEYLIDKG